MSTYALPRPSAGYRHLGADDPDWHLDPLNIALLLRYLEVHGLMDEPASYIVEKPVKWTPEWRAALAWRENEEAHDGA